MEVSRKLLKSGKAALALGIGCAVGLSLLVLGSKAATPATHGPTVAVTVAASDTSGGILHYSWKSTDGSITNVNAATTSWVLPTGPGLHFAYVLVSNGRGGYTERRIAVNTDTIGTIGGVPPAEPYQAPAAVAQTGDYWRAHQFLDCCTDVSGNRSVRIPNAQAFLVDLVTGFRYPPTGTVTTDPKGDYVVAGVPPSTNESATCIVDGTTADCTPSPFPVMLPDATTHYVELTGGSVTPPSLVGAFTLQDGTPCGTNNEFFGVHATATAKLEDATKRVLYGPVNVNEFGDYFLPILTGGVSAVLTCEQAPPVTIPFGGANLGTTLLAGVTPPTVTTMTASLNGVLLKPPVAIFLPPVVNEPTDISPRDDNYLAIKGLDSRLGACEYYLAIGAVRGCTTAGGFTNPISFLDWQKAVKIGQFATGGVPTYTASYINKVDLNLARVQTSISYGPKQTAAVVCNHLGATDFFNPTQADIDTAVLNAVGGKNLVACVAMDYVVSPGVNNNQPFIRFLIFGPSGQLLPSVNLDGRREKFVPGTCVVCHGGDHYAGKFPENHTGFANVGGHFLPYDVGNFEFASTAGLKKCDQETAIYNLNQNILNANATVAEQELIHGWYSTRGNEGCAASVTHVLNENYLPASWATQDATSVAFYQNVIARSCRTCHVAMIDGFNFDHYTNIVSNNNPQQLPGGSYDFAVTVCGGPNSLSANFVRWYTMPNSLVTFNRFWLSYQNTIGIPDQATLLQNFLTDTGNGGFCTPIPK